MAPDYLPTLATILMLIADSLRENRTKSEIPTQFSVDTLNALKDELMSVGRDYALKPTHTIPPRE